MNDKEHNDPVNIMFIKCWNWTLFEELVDNGRIYEAGDGTSYIN